MDSGRVLLGALASIATALLFTVPFVLLITSGAPIGASAVVSAAIAVFVVLGVLGLAVSGRPPDNEDPCDRRGKNPAAHDWRYRD